MKSIYVSEAFIPEQNNDILCSALLWSGIYHKEVDMCINLIKKFPNADSLIYSIDYKNTL